jgi:hypothetical protein
MTGMTKSDPLPFDWGMLVPHVLHPIKVTIIEAMSWIGEPLSATDLRKVFDSRCLTQTVGYHIGGLVEAGALVQVGRRRVRGATECFYFFPKPPRFAEELDLLGTSKLNTTTPP